MNVKSSVGITAVLALTISCAPARVGPAEAQPQASTAVEGPVGNAGRARYVGEYEVNGATMMIRLRGDVLFREMGGQAGQTLTPVGKSETRFKLGSTPVELEFQSDNSGGMTLVMRAPGKPELRGVRVR